jgi:hypothetical protein
MDVKGPGHPAETTRPCRAALGGTEQAPVSIVPDLGSFAKLLSLFMMEVGSLYSLFLVAAPNFSVPRSARFTSRRRFPWCPLQGQQDIIPFVVPLKPVYIGQSPRQSRVVSTREGPA